MSKFVAINGISQIEKMNLRINGFEVLPVRTGVFGLDGGAMFGTVPKVLWEKHFPADEQNRIPMEARALLLKGSKKNILIDTGNGGDFVAKYGPKIGPKFAEMYNLSSEQPEIVPALEKLGVRYDEVTDVILTHLHFDHAGGATTCRDGKLVPTFPKARFYLQEKNLISAKNPNLRERASYFPANYQPLIEAGVLQLVTGDVEIFSGIRMMVSNGHTLGQQAVVVSDSGAGLVYCGDMIPTTAHVRLPWVMGYDLDPLLLIEEKKQLLETVVAQNWMLFFEHDAICDGARVVKNGDDFAVAQKFNFH